jgi:PAS domain S-box-containing protein
LTFLPNPEASLVSFGNGQSFMNFALAPYLFTIYISVTVCWFAAFYAWRRREVTAASTFTVVALFAGFWAFFYGLELIADSLEYKLLWFNIKQLGASVLGPGVLLLAFRYTHQNVRYSRLLIGLLVAEPIASQIVFWTNGWHGLAGTPSLVTENVPFPLLTFAFGPWYWFSVFVGYLFLTLAVFILLAQLPGANKLYRRHLTLLLLGLIIPWAAGSLGLLDFNNWHLFDVTTFFFSISVPLIGLALFRYQLLQLSPVAYSAVFSSIRDGIIVMNDDGRIIELNPAALHLLGLRERELIGQHISEILPIQSPEFADKKRTIPNHNLEFFYEGGGQNRFLEAHGGALFSNIYDASGHVLILYDVTDRILAEKARQFVENRYRTFFETDSAATIILEADMTISLANEQFATLSGYSRQEIEGKLLWTQFVHEADLPQMQAFHRARRQGDKSIPNQYEFRFITRHNKMRNVYVSVAMVPDTSTSIASLLDITDRKLAEQLLKQRATDLEAAVRAEQERSAIILQSISDAIAVSDLTYKFIYVNPSFVRLTNYSHKELLGKSAKIILNGRLPQPIWRQLTNALLDQKVWEGEIQIRCKNGKSYDAAMLIAPVFDGNKKLIGYVSSHRDITEAKRLDESRRRFVTNISHELRTPVTNLKLYTALLHRHFDSSRRDHYFGVLSEQIDRLERMIQNTLEIADLEDNRTYLQRKLIHWESLSDSLQLRLHPQAVEKKISLKFDPTMLQLPSFLGDSQRLIQATYELVHNALTFSDPGGTVIVSGAVQEKEGMRWLLLSVCDSGPGIDPQEQIYLFDRFFRGKHAAAKQIPGTGLGLSMVKLIAEAHNGRITLQSTPGHGSTFTLWLPLS